MISRRRILSRSRDDLNSADYNMMDEEEDVWYQKEKLYKDHIQEVLDKWTQIDDEIWAKVICLERNRRVAKAYARTPVLTINGSDDGFDGYRIGLCGFDNPMRDAKTEEVKRHIGHGVKIKMDNAGNILVKRVSKCNVFVKDAIGSDENSISAEALKLPNGALEMEKPVKLFDMKKFQQNVSKELKRAYPDRRKLECQCMSTVVFVKHEQDILDCPCWIMLINIVAMDMLKSKLPPIQKKPSGDIRSRPRLPIPDEDPYSIPGSGSGSSSSRERRTDRPPKLPPRDVTMGAYHIPKERDEMNYHSKGFNRHQNPIEHRMPDYDERSDENRLHLPHLQASSRKKGAPFHDDPYYCGMRAHIPNFAKNRVPSGGNSTVSMNSSKKMMMAGHPPPPSPWHRGMERSNYDSGLEADYAGALEDPYASIYGRLPVMPHGYPPHFREVPSVGEWDGY